MLHCWMLRQGRMRSMADDLNESGDFIRQGTGIRAVLQAVEDALVENGYDDLLVATNHARILPLDEGAGEASQRRGEA